MPNHTSADDASEGARLFALHCAACHGSDAQGSGSVAGSLKGTPTDLTLLAKENGGSFPVFDVISKIDGRTPVADHGGDMPVYRWFFQDAEKVVLSEHGAEMETTAHVAALVRWLKSVQQ